MKAALGIAAIIAGTFVSAYIISTADPGSTAALRAKPPARAASAAK